MCYERYTFLKEHDYKNMNDKCMMKTMMKTTMKKTCMTTVFTIRTWMINVLQKRHIFKRIASIRAIYLFISHTQVNTIHYVDP